MKKASCAALVLALGTLFASVARAAPVDLTACTKDGHGATLKMDLKGKIGDTPLKDLAELAFLETGWVLDAKKMAGPEGLQTFGENVSKLLAPRLRAGEKLDDDASYDILGKIQISPGCPHSNHARSPLRPRQP